jgi:hypothetical protein
VLRADDSLRHDGAAPREIAMSAAAARAPPESPDSATFDETVSP